MPLLCFALSIFSSQMDRCTPTISGNISDAAADTAAPAFCYPSNIAGYNNSGLDSRFVKETKDYVRKTHKADREKLRRERLNEQFLELGKALDPERPKNDKATVLNDAIQMLKDLTAQVSRLKFEHTSLSEESRELTQEKNELREEKAALKSEIDSLNSQYQQRMRLMCPWAPAAYPFVVPVPIPSGPVAVHPSMQPFSFLPNHIPASATPNPHQACFSYHNCVPGKPPDHHCCPPNPHHRGDSNADEQEPELQFSVCRRQGSTERCEGYSDVATELELKTPGSATTSQSQTELSNAAGRVKNLPCRRAFAEEESCSSRCSSPSSLPEIANSVRDSSVVNGN